MKKGSIIPNPKRDEVCVKEHDYREKAEVEDKGEKSVIEESEGKEKLINM